ncbi:hypothetical protein BSLG_006013 [Batrachochytrium salamandrivorans]|nr:hypothetical protein BSLG_006013 [Batrachochytrium salamandrivorans]
MYTAKPPVAKIQPVATVLHNVSIIDNYAWPRWIDADPDVRQYLLKENIYAEKYLETLNNVTSETQYQPEEMVLDFNTILSKDTQYYYIGAFEVNPFMPNLVAYSIDLAGSERYTLRVRDIHKGVNLDIPAIENTYYSVRWAHDSTTDAASHWLYFNTVDQQYGTPMEIHRVCIWNCIDQFGLIIGTVPEIVYIESDISFTTELASSTDDSLIFVKDGLRQLCITDLQTDPYACHQIQFHLHDQPSTQVYSLLPELFQTLKHGCSVVTMHRIFVYRSSLLELSTVFYIDFSKPMPTFYIALRLLKSNKIDGKYEAKINTMSDTRKCIQELVKLGYSKPGAIALKARSAGV